jgi:phosphopantothenoylcysteine decarboxylase/phosphopantothenate--cysteine ligase
MNSLKDANAGFGHDTNKVTIISSNGKTVSLGLKSKKDVARDIVSAICDLSGIE